MGIYKMEHSKNLLQVEFEQQSLGYSCAAKCLQLVLNFHDSKKFPLGSDLELEILKESKLGNYNEATHPGLVLYVLRKGFNVDYITNYDDLFRYPVIEHAGYTMSKSEFDEKIKIDKEYFKKALELGVKNILFDKVTTNEIKKYIDLGFPLVVMTDNGGSLHDVVIRGYKNNIFKIVDPISGYRSIHKDDVEKMVNTRYGSSIFVVKP
jgi:hypothetical protein